jgi:hypothetical protein
MPIPTSLSPPASGTKPTSVRDLVGLGPRRLVGVRFSGVRGDGERHNAESPRSRHAA